MSHANKLWILVGAAVGAYIGTLPGIWLSFLLESPESWVFEPTPITTVAVLVAVVVSASIWG